LVFADGAAKERVFAGAKVIVLSESHAVVNAVAIVHQGANLGFCPVGYVDFECAVSQPFDGFVVAL
jgi:hypothetical protein